MVKTQVFLIASLFITLTINAQNLLFIGEDSYPCTESFPLQSNLDEGENLNVVIAKDGIVALFAVSAKSNLDAIFSGKLIIYLNDGTVITCSETGESEYVDDTARALYSLTNDQVNKMKNSNIHTVRYTFTILGIKEVNRSASNKETQTKNIITEFFDNNDGFQKVTKEKPQREKEAKKKKLDELMGGLDRSDGDPFATSYYGSPGSGDETGGYGLNGRSLVNQGKVQQECNQEGRVVVKIVVDQNGKVIDATPGVKGTTNNHPCLMDPARKTAFLHRWNPDAKAPDQQVGFVVVNFKLRE